MHLSLLKTRPFNKFVEMELERDNLYRSFTTLDQPEEISAAWITFAESCSQNLSVINNLADMSIQRLYDVFIDISQGKDNPLGLHQLLYGDFRNQLMALNSFELQLGILTYVYSQVRNRGVFDFSPDSSQYIYYITSKESIDRILYRILNKQIPDVEVVGLTPSFSNDELLQVIMPLIQLENMKRLIPIYDSLPGSEEDPRVLSTKGEYDYLQGITLLTHIIGIARKASQDFWWADPISELSILNHAKEHFETVIELWNRMPETLGSRAIAIQSEFLPIVDAHSSISLVQHFKLLAQSAMESGDLHHAVLYFSEAKKEFDKACKLLEQSESPESALIHQRIQKEESELEILHTISELALKYTNIVNDLYAQETDKAVKSCMEIEKLLEKIETAGSLPYIYGVSVIYSSASSIITDLVEQDTSNLNVIDRLTSQFQFPLKAMSSALKEVHLAFLRVDDNNPMQSYQELQDLDEKLSYLEKAIELLPPFLSEKDAKGHRIHAMRNYIKSLIAENKTYIYADNNIVLDLILRARAHYYAKRAEQSISEIKGKTKEKEMKNLISKRLVETKMQGMITESSLVSLGLQSTYKNDVRRFIEELIGLIMETEELPEFMPEAIGKQFDEMFEFHEMLELIQIDTQELIAANVEVSIKGNEINWNYIKRRASFIPAIKKMHEAIKFVLLGELNILTKNKTKAEGSYNKAGDIFYEISEALGKIIEHLEDQKELPQLVYTLSLFSRENASAIRDRRKVKDVPYNEIVSTMDYLILNL
jgi:tetratricopeptide (TPR) repeat protein